MLKFGSRGSGDGLFNYPSGADYSPNGSRIAVADQHNNRIQVFDADTGDFVLKFGSRGSGDGLFNYPYSVVYSPLP